MATHMEIEVKLRWERDAPAARSFLERLGYQLKKPRIHECNQLFDRPGAELQSRDQLLRLRRAGDRAIVTYKGPSQRARHKSREEIEFEVSNPENFAEVLDRLGYLPGFRYEKYRTELAIPEEPGVVTIDETPMGVFLELEGPAEWIDRTAARLGFRQSAYLTASYPGLYWEFRSSHPEAPADMVFGSGKPL